ncbi:MAG: histidine kinase [Alphaproteobacteria bacterium 41-28]|nr:MAG: histidine kinase [Alphaproteobacteria bacterium 41-28]
MNRPAFDQEDFFSLLQKANRGRLKIYTGPVAGVGKTYRMLEEAHSLKSQGADIVLAYIETHGRMRLEELLNGLEIIPRKKYEYRGVTLEEMDLDAVLKRKPQIAIVDEVAHTNAPLCRNAKRYQDIMELLRAGINVICAFNIQHLESLSDVIKKFTDVTIYETIPDTFLKHADQVINVDLGVEDILERLQSGQIYHEEKVALALKNFFKEENLSKLREIALREVAEAIEQATHRPHKRTLTLKEALFASNQIMVCLLPQRWSQRSLFKKAARLAGRLNKEWFVVYAETPDDEPEKIDLEKQRYLFADIQFAKDLGAHVVHLKTQNRIQAWLDFAEKEGISQIIIGRVEESWWKEALGLDTLHFLLRLSKNFDLYVMSYHNSKREGDIS